MNLYQVTTEKLRELKTWAQVKSPKTLQPALSYALDWLAPELLGTGFRMVEISDYSVKAMVPAQKSNFDFQNEIHHGLVLNAGLELARSFLQKQMPENIFSITGTQIQLNKKMLWKSDLELVLLAEASALDDFYIQLQKNKKAKIELTIKIQAEQATKADHLEIKLNIEKTELIA